ncbi:hypothetical protein E2C01_051704 [Portunus trituberculatus]|uniref:Uncharacterized protein n=1 Tax=Portunus trituberculatus TaxID=210409 RepID=A0A5B7GKA7_PORTR|nr:hypothetical protein [Portunus trituberculatus]
MEPTQPCKSMKESERGASVSFSYKGLTNLVFSFRQGPSLPLRVFISTTGTREEATSQASCFSQRVSSDLRL